MDKKELKALPQSKMDGPVENRCQFDVMCSDCGKSIKTGTEYYQLLGHGGTLEPYYTICPACRASHPSGEPKRRFVVGAAINPVLWCDGQKYEGRDGSVRPSSYKTVAAALMNDCYDREIDKPAALAWAEQHGLFAALFGGEEPDVWPVFFIDEFYIVRATSEDDGTFITGGSGEPCKTDGASHHREPDYHYTEITCAAARAEAKTRGWPWPSSWGEPAEPAVKDHVPEKAFPRWFHWKEELWRTDGPVGKDGLYANEDGSTEPTEYLLQELLDDPDYDEITLADARRITADWPANTREYLGLEPDEARAKPTCVGCLSWDGRRCRDRHILPSSPCRHRTTEPEPAPSAPQPVAYSCRECGGVLVDGIIGRSCPKCVDALWPHAQYPHGACPMPSWVQPGPLPGPWQEQGEWKGEFRPAKKYDRRAVLSTASGKWELRYNKTTEPVHILRPKPKPAATVPAPPPPPPPPHTINKDHPLSDSLVGYWVGGVDLCDEPTPSGKDATMSKTLTLRIPVPPVAEIATFIWWLGTRPVKLAVAHVRNPWTTLKWAACHVACLGLTAFAVSDHWIAIVSREAIGGLFAQAYEGTIGRFIG